MKFPCAKICQLSGFSKVLVFLFRVAAGVSFNCDPLGPVLEDFQFLSFSHKYTLMTQDWSSQNQSWGHGTKVRDVGGAPIVSGVWLIEFRASHWQVGSAICSVFRSSSLWSVGCFVSGNISLQVAILPCFSKGHCFWQILWQNSGWIPWTEEPGRVQSVGSQIFLFSPWALQLKRNLTLTVRISHLPGS